LVRYFDRYAEIARRDGVGIVLETQTWRANPDWGSRQGYAAAALDAANRDAVDLVLDTRARWEQPSTPVVVSGCIGPRGDGYQPDSILTADEAQAYHAVQIGTFADTEADLVTAITMTHTGEAIGLTRAAQAEDMPVVISFTTETDGRLPTGESLGEAIAAVDAATDSGPAYYMINCAHPEHFSGAIEPDAEWVSRVLGVRANASRLSHAELDEAEELDPGNPQELAQDYVALSSRLPRLSVLGGCCGTTHEHVSAISRAFATH
jgi:S-methylmethionine-dependent homocysteine/selenocysteine methylase